MINLPDLSYLTHEEQQKILNVIKRQHDEENRERSLLRALHKQFEDYKAHIKLNAEESKIERSSCYDNDPVCGLCYKTKFAEGCGHFCAFCQVRFCSRCGGRIALKSNKTIWICNLCRKQKEILSKSGDWLNGNSCILALSSRNFKAADFVKSENAVKEDYLTEGKQIRELSKDEESSEKTEDLSIRHIYQPCHHQNLNGSMVSDQSNEVRKTAAAAERNLQTSVGNNVQSSPSAYKETSVFNPTSPEEKGYYAIEHNDSLPSTMSDDYELDKIKYGSLASLEDNQSTTDYSSSGDAEKETSTSDFEHCVQNSMSVYETLKRNRYEHHCYEEICQNSSLCLCCRTQSTDNKVDDAPYCNYGCVDGQNPLISWQPSSDGFFLIGHLTLCKNLPMADKSMGVGRLLGMKVVGGKATECGRLGAFVTRIRKGSLADTVGHLKPGDEIISWNKHCLQDATFDEVYDIILESKSFAIVELVVSRPIKETPRIPETRIHQTVESSSCSLDSERRDMDVCMNKPSLGKVQVKMWYDCNTWQLYVTALRAKDLTTREGGLSRNPYLKMYLLPDRSNGFKRRTKTAKKTLAPEWLQTFVYSDVRRDDLGALALELTLWDFDRSLAANNKFMGEVIIDLGLVCMNDEPHWFQLMPLGYGVNQDYESTTLPQLPSSVASSSINLSCNSSGSAVKSTYDLGIQSKRLLPHIPCSSSTLSMSKKTVLHSPVSVSVSHESAHPESLHRSEKSFGSGAISVDHTLQDFVGGVGPGQIVGRQVLAMSPVGEIEMVFHREAGRALIRIRNAYQLACRTGAKIVPAYCVKVYMMSGVQRIAKRKTKSVRSFSPVFNESFTFENTQIGNMVQVIVLGDYGRMDTKVFTGSVQILLDNLDMSQPVSGRYKLFLSSTIYDPFSYSARQDSYSSFGSSSVVHT